MKADLWLCPSGQAKIAAGREADYSDLGFSTPGLGMESQGWTRIDTLVIETRELPGRDECIRLTLERLFEQETRLREKLNEDLARIEQMRSEMLAIEGTPAKVERAEEDDDGCPF